ncbi:DUF3144 domain-containing protein [Thermomonas haemolytica]|uniref:Uncharacterized protein DUF3144 n=1 Tax=Thermomonas haemolytica TaxID=141949 RepID=A0A4V2V1G0_9GAMM|nr:DUF3144 domain-containing protein [Thermomonas haemolytica]TCT21032.1 uncharacterized protein DUF3144 [Thermomonas haemolytica]TNY29166.1 hypothetical protein BV505_06895 [Thermomonas haemolytica]
MADETQAQPAAEQQNVAGGTPFPPQFFECVNEYLELTHKQSQKYGEKNISLAALFAAARFNAHVYLTSVKPIAAAEERVPFLDYMTTMYRRMLNEHLDGMGEERGIDVGDSELAEEYKAAGVKIGRLKDADTTAAAANE